MSATKVELQQVSKWFLSPSGERVEVLNDISITVPEGQFVTLLGPSGCGKTTLLKIVAGLVGPSHGRILFDGHEVQGPSYKRGYVPQAYTLFPWLTVEANIEFGLKRLSVQHNDRKKRVQEMLDLVGLNDFRNYHPKALSGGMKQRVAIARALAPDPDVLLMDEPFGALDAQTRAAMQRQMLAMLSRAEMTVLFVTHDITEAILLSDWIYVATFRPARIAKVLRLELPRSRDKRSMPQPEILKLFAEITASLNSSSSKLESTYEPE